MSPVTTERAEVSRAMYHEAETESFCGIGLKINGFATIFNMIEGGETGYRTSSESRVASWFGILKKYRKPLCVPLW